MRGKLVFWLITGLALIWNGLGCMNLVQQLSPEGIASLPPDYQDFIGARPHWGFVGFAVSVVAGLAGAVLLALRSDRAGPAFVLSCLGAVVATLPTFGTGIPSVIIGSALSVLLAGFCAIYARRVLG